MNITSLANEISSHAVESYQPLVPVWAWVVFGITCFICLTLFIAFCFRQRSKHFFKQQTGVELKVAKEMHELENSAQRNLQMERHLNNERMEQIENDILDKWF